MNTARETCCAASTRELKMQASEIVERRTDPLEHRWGRRISVDVPVRLDLGQPVGHGLMRTASISGAFIETAVELPVFSNLVVVLPASAAGPSGFRELVACVVRREVAGLAVEWRDMECTAIVELLERISGRHADTLHEDEAFTARRTRCALVSS
jgi:hypothetical protein